MSLQKLVTHEDKFHLHKIVGISCIISYFFNIGKFLFTNDPTIHPGFCILHMLLHVTSFMFKVLSHRGKTKILNFYIWQELRLHALIFSWRACLILLGMNNVFAVFLTLLSADTATYYYGESNISTVRGKHTSSTFNLKKASLQYVFSVSQFGATVLCLTGNEFPILVFSTLPAIQLSSFAMTLIRKNIITKETWTIIYTITLCLSYYIWFCCYSNLNVLWMAILLYIFRKMNINKYILWTGFILLHTYSTSPDKIRKFQSLFSI